MAKDICVPEPKPTCSGIADSMVISTLSDTFKASHINVRHLSARCDEGPVTNRSTAGLTDIFVTYSFKATPILPKWRSNDPLKSINPMCNLAGAITETFE